MAACKFLTLFILLSLLNPILSEPNYKNPSPTEEQKDCKGRWIHIRHLPPRFNLDLLANCSEYPIFDDFCPYLANHGLGELTHNRSLSWYRTDPLMLEPLFHRRIQDYPCLTPDPKSASAVFLPYYAALDALRFLYGSDVNFSASHGLELHRFLITDSPQIFTRRGGHDHFLVMARPAWDFSQSPWTDPPIWGTSFLEIPEFFNVTALTLESRAWPWQEQAVPYPTSFHPRNLDMYEKWIGRARRSRRKTLALFAGGGGVSTATPNVRRSIRDECENTTLCFIVDCSNGICEHDPVRYMKPMLGSRFCLQPPGDTPTRRSTFDGILAGCIPVFFEEQAAKTQYGWHLPESEYGQFSVLIPKEDVMLNGVKMLEVLRGISKAEVRRMREKLLEMLPRIMYRNHRSSLGMKSKKDAFDIAIDGTLDKIRTRIRQLEIH